jgi:hypothetical protein
MTTEQEARAYLAILPEPEVIDLATLAKLIDADVRQALASHIREACETSREQHCVADLRAKGGHVHDALMSLPRLAGRGGSTT